jgi:hypothetical protein
MARGEIDPATVKHWDRETKKKGYRKLLEQHDRNRR